MVTAEARVSRKDPAFVTPLSVNSPGFDGVESVSHPDLRMYLQSYRKTHAASNVDVWEAMPLEYVRDHYLGVQPIADVFDVPKGVQPSAFFQEVINRRIVLPVQTVLKHEEVEGITTMVHFDQIRMDAVAALRFIYRRRVFLYGSKRALNWKIMVGDIRAMLADHPIAAHIRFPEESLQETLPERKPAKTHALSIELKPKPVQEPKPPAGKRVQPAVVFTPTPLKPTAWSFGERGSTALSGKRVPPPPTPPPPEIKPVPGATITERLQYISAREKAKSLDKDTKDTVVFSKSPRGKSQKRPSGPSWQTAMRNNTR